MQVALQRFKSLKPGSGSQDFSTLKFARPRPGRLKDEKNGVFNAVSSGLLRDDFGPVPRLTEDVPDTVHLRGKLVVLLHEVSQPTIGGNLDNDHFCNLLFFFFVIIIYHKFGHLSSTFFIFFRFWASPLRPFRDRPLGTPLWVWSPALTRIFPLSDTNIAQQPGLVNPFFYFLKKFFCYYCARGAGGRLSYFNNLAN